MFAPLGRPTLASHHGIFFAHTSTRMQVGQRAAGRIYGRTTNKDEQTSRQTRQAQFEALRAWELPNYAMLERLSAIAMPVFVAIGDSDHLILTRFSYLLAGLFPNARLRIYPDAAHGFLFQHHTEFAADVHAFLAEAT
jgi:pimeloyl-ACP methyl ester carboxylesterase